MFAAEAEEGPAVRSGFRGKDEAHAARPQVVVDEGLSRLNPYRRPGVVERRIERQPACASRPARIFSW